MILSAWKRAFHHCADDIEEFLTFIFFLFIMIGSSAFVIASIFLSGLGLFWLLQ